MTEINLLPWREARREKEKKTFNIYLAIGFVVAACIVLLLNMYANALIEYQQKRNQRLKTEISRYENQLKEIKNLKTLREALIARMNIVQNLQATRTLTVRLFDELVKILPQGVFLTQLDRVGNKITVFGYSESNSHISELMKKIETNPWIQSPKLTEIKRAEDNTRAGDKQFKLSFTLGPIVDGSSL